VSGLANGTSYVFTVTAVNAVGVSVASGPSNSEVPMTVPDPPTNVVATAEDESAVISWTAPDDDGGTPMTGFTATASPGGQSCSTTGALSCTVRSLQNWTYYTFTVTGTNDVGASAPSAPSSSVEPTVSVDLSGQAAASDGDGFCTILTTGGINCWGSNQDGDLGTGAPGGASICDGDYNSTGQDCTDFPQAVIGITDAVAITGGSSSYCALLSSGGIECWGNNSSGELGVGTVGDPYLGGTDYYTPQAVTGITDAVSIATDDSGSYCAVLSSGGIDCWGDNQAGELGDGTIGGPDYCNDDYNCTDVPQAVIGISDAVSITGNSYSYCAVLTTGAINCWGGDDDGKLGNGTIAGPDAADASPQAVIGITSATSIVSNDDATPFTNGDSGSYCAVLSSGGIDCWGYNGLGELGNGTIGGTDACGEFDNCDDLPQPVTGIADAISISGNQYGYCALLSAGGIECWGFNGDGELGDGTVGGPDYCYGGDYCNDAPQAVTGITDAISITTNRDSQCAVLSTGAIDCWGDDEYGELGNGTIAGPNACLSGDDFCADAPQAVMGITDAVSMTPSRYDSYCATLTTGSINCWGANEDGELGNRTMGGPIVCGVQSGYLCNSSPQTVFGFE
jgi:alpha-tubulin suppressor-like RCC1 family protein